MNILNRDLLILVLGMVILDVALRLIGIYQARKQKKLAQELAKETQLSIQEKMQALAHLPEPFQKKDFQVRELKQMQLQCEISKPHYQP